MSDCVVMVSRDALQLLFDGWMEADAANMFGSCEEDPCPYCTMGEQIQMALDSGDVE